ncbi:serine/threonine-protein kinase [Actinomadura macrotermitis]|uniref:Serine/threonine-protein kinase PknD n=1 Tax=Actinomadura macrotermitis TaxID=2585200 RepID=A0A7K0C7M9_9ACTN|nr:serine/threonine-protein kinase [Actinomadura macrotermitis]MQY09471.1 Serine/threonine-protein kinase PknD [Actinomadura macrotermitis]
MPVTPLTPRDPEEIGGHRLTGRIGEGGQGQVYLGETADGDRVAIKLLHTGDPLREAAAARRVSPFCTARVLETGEQDGVPFVVSEYIDGPTLRAVVEEQGPRHGAGLYRLAVGTATALAAIHEAGVTHRDFKPANVLLGPDGPRVIDFGIARATDATLTATGSVLGSPSYMAPEQLAGDAVGPAADVFAWGATIAYAANGRPPYGQDTIPAVMHRIVTGEPDLGALPGQLRALVADCLAKDAARRPLSRDVLLRLLEHTEAPISAPDALALGRATAVAPDIADDRTTRWTTMRLPAPAGPRKRNRMLLACGGVAVTALVIATAFAIRESGSSSAKTLPLPSPAGAPTTTAPPSRIDTATQVEQAIAAKRTASFKAKGAMSQSDDQFNASGRLQYRPGASTDYDLTVHNPEGGESEDSPRRLTLKDNTAQFSDMQDEVYSVAPRTDYSGMDPHVYMAMETRWVSSPHNVLALLRSTRKLRHASDGGTVTYRGVTSAAALSRKPAVAPFYKNFGNSKTEFTIVLSNDHLPRRLDIVFTTGLDTGEHLRSVYSAEYTEWGRSGIIAP